MSHYITEIESINEYTLTLRFNTGETKSVNLHDELIEWSRSTGSAFTHLLDQKYFSRVHLNNDFGSIYWDNGIDLCPEVLYELALQSERNNETLQSNNPDSLKHYKVLKTDVKVLKEKNDDENSS